MKRFYKYSQIVLFIFIFNTVGCITHHIKKYVTPKTNMSIYEGLKQKGYKINVGEFKSLFKDDDLMSCRGFPVLIKDNKFHDYIKNALIAEFKKGGIYSEKTVNTISAQIHNIKLKTRGIGIWQIDITYFLNGKEIFTLNSIYKFTVAFDGSVSCYNASYYFAGAVQELIEKTVGNEAFEKNLRK